MVSKGFVEEVTALLPMSMMQNECPCCGVAGVELNPMVVSSPCGIARLCSAGTGCSASLYQASLSMCDLNQPDTLYRGFSNFPEVLRQRQSSSESWVLKILWKNLNNFLWMIWPDVFKSMLFLSAFGSAKHTEHRGAWVSLWMCPCVISFSCFHTCLHSCYCASENKKKKKKSDKYKLPAAF